MKTMNHQEVPTVGLEIRSLNGVDVVFTTDGKMLANQSDSGHIYYKQEPNRLNVRCKTFRAEFLIDNDLVTMQGPVNVGGKE